MKNIAKRIVSLLICLVLVLTVAGCGKGDDKSKNEGKKLFSDPIEFTVLMNEHPSVPYTGTEIKFKEITNKTNVTLKLDITPQSEFAHKLTTVLASGQMYDIVSLNSVSTMRKYSTDLYMDLTDYLETDLKNYYRWVKDDEMVKRNYINGRCYQLICLSPPAGYWGEELSSISGEFPVIRYDILEANNLPVPKDWNEFFTVMKKLKTIYPDSTPWGTRSSRTLLRNATYSMGARMDFHYDYEKEKYTFGVLDSKFKNIVQYLVNCYNEGIIDPAFDTANTNIWESGVSSGKMFFWYDNSNFADAQTATLKQSNPDAKFQVMPLMKDFEGKKRAIMYTNFEYDGGFVLNAKTKYPEKLRKFMDWCYSDEGLYVTNFGKEGETYTLNKDGSVNIPDSIIDEFRGNTSPIYAWNSAYGVGQLCFTPLFGGDLVFSNALGTFNNEPMQILKEDYEAGYMNGRDVTPALSSDIMADIETKRNDIDNTIFQHVMKIVNGKLDISTLDGLIAQIKDMGAQEVLDAYNNALK